MGSNTFFSSCLSLPEDGLFGRSGRSSVVMVVLTVLDLSFSFRRSVLLCPPDMET